MNRASLLLLILPALAGCGDSTSPSAVAGNYHATTFTLTRTGSPPADVLAAGGSMIALLGEDGTLGANLVIPQSLTDDAEHFEVMMLGTWTQSGNTLRFRDDQDDSFVEDMEWTVGSNTLSGTYTDIDGSIQITLTWDTPP